MGLECGDLPSERTVLLVLQTIKSLSEDVGIPENLEVLGVKREDFDTLASNAMKDACGLTNPNQPTKEEIVALFEEAYTQKYGL